MKNLKRVDFKLLRKDLAVHGFYCVKYLHTPAKNLIYAGDGMVKNTNAKCKKQFRPRGVENPSENPFYAVYVVFFFFLEWKSEMKLLGLKIENSYERVQY